MGTLCAQLLLQFVADSFETSHVFWPWSEDIHMVWIKSSDYLFFYFSAISSSFRHLYEIRQLFCEINIIVINLISNRLHSDASFEPLFAWLIDSFCFYCYLRE